MAKQPAQQPRPIIVKKVIADGHDGHHGGAWKVAYADFVTAMMAFFLLMWLVGATTEKQRKALADYFAPTIALTKNDSAGANGFFGGDSIVSVDKYPNRAGQTGTRALTVPRDVVGGPKEASGHAMDKINFEELKKLLEKQMRANRSVTRFAKNIFFSETREGLRIEMVDMADFSMFLFGTDQMTGDAIQLLQQVAIAMQATPNPIIIRGHTDATPYTDGHLMNNWRLSAFRAEATRAFLSRNSVDPQRMSRIEGVADTEPYVVDDGFDPRNRRISITLAWSDGKSSE